MAFGDFTVARNSVKNVLNSAGLLAEVAVNTPAFEFNADGSYKGLLVEPSATNLVLRSQNFTNAAWTTNGGGFIVTANATTAPNGTLTADAVLANTVTGVHLVQQRNLSVTSGLSYTWSIFVKRNGYRYVAISLEVNVTSSVVTLDFDTGIATGGSGTVVLALANGWYRLSATTTASATGATRLSVRLRDDDNNASFTGDDTKGVFAWQADLIQSTVAQSPIPTVASTVTRLADSITLTGASSLIGQTEGTIYVSTYLRPQTIARRVAGISDGTATARLGVTIASNQVPSVILNGSIALISSGAITTEGVYKFCITYTASKVAFFRNGVKIGEVATSGSGAYTDVILGQTELGAATLNDNISTYWNGPTAISDAQAIAMTTL